MSTAGYLLVLANPATGERLAVPLSGLPRQERRAVLDRVTEMRRTALDANPAPG